MTDSRTLYATLLGITEPWGVELVEMKQQAGEVHVTVALPANTRWVCPECHTAAPIHDHQDRTWRHLDTCQFKTLVHARVPRLNCPTHGIRQLRVAWAEPGSRFTALFEALAIDWLKQASLSAVAKQLRISWDEADGIMARAVQRGLARRRLEPPRYAGVDETSFQKRHEYVTVASDLERTRVLYVGDDRGQEALDGFWRSWTPEQRARIEAVAMDMWEPYVNSTAQMVPQGAEKIVHDPFHMMQHMNGAVNDVRKAEYRSLRAEGDDSLEGTRWLWLYGMENVPESRGPAFDALKFANLKTSRAWALKEMLRTLWFYRSRAWAEQHFRRWYNWAIRSRLEPVKKVARMLKSRLANILTYCKTRPDQRPSGRAEQQDSGLDQESLRLPEQTKVHHRHLFPLWRTQPLSEPMKNPTEMSEEAAFVPSWRKAADALSKRGAITPRCLP